MSAMSAMHGMVEACRTMPDEDLLRELLFHAERARRGLAAMIVHLAEYDRRHLAQKNGHESTFMFCVRVLRFDEGDAYRRVHAARVSRRCERILPGIESGGLTLTSILLLAPILTEDNQDAVLREADGKTKREVELLVAARDPLPSAPDSLRRLPGPAWGPAASAVFVPGPPPDAGAAADDAVPAPAAGETPAELIGVLPSSPPREWQAIMPISADRVRIGFDAALAVRALIDRARQVLRHKYPEGRLEDLVKEALELLLDRKDPQRRLGLDAAKARAAAALPSPPEPRFLRAMRTGRYIPARVKAAVWRRDDGRCAWRSGDGRPCGSRDALEYDHVRPFSRGGRSDDPRNVRLLCRRHNREAAEAAGLSPGPRARTGGGAPGTATGARGGECA
jgi:hypothetical protein